MPEVKLEDVPKKVRDIYNKGYAAMERGRTDFAIQMFHLALETEPGLLRARELVRRIEIREAKEKKILAGLSTITGLGGVMSVKKAIKKDPAKALQLAEDLLRKDVKNLQFVDLFCEAAVAAGQPEAAAQTLALVSSELFPDNNDLLEKLGDMYREIGDSGAALDAYQELSNRDKTNQKILKKIRDVSATHSMERDGYVEAAEKGDFRVALGNKEEAEELERLAKAKGSESDLERNIESYRSRIAAEPDNLNHYRGLADVHAKAGQYDEARQVLEQAYELSGKADPEIDRAISRMNVKIYQSNIEYYESEGDAANAEETRRALHEYELADARDCVERYPNDNQHKFRYGKLLFDQGDIGDAIPLFQKSRTHPKCRQEALFYLARCFKARGTLDLAVETLQEALKEIHGMSHTKKDILYEMGTIKDEMGDADGAMECYKQIYQVDYEYKDVATRIESRSGVS